MWQQGRGGWKRKEKKICLLPWRPWAWWILPEEIVSCLSVLVPTGLYKHNSVSLGLCSKDPVSSFTQPRVQGKAQGHWKRKTKQNKKTWACWKAESSEQALSSFVFIRPMYKSYIPVSAPIPTVLALRWGYESKPIREPESLCRLKAESKRPPGLLKSSFSVRLSW